MKELECLLVAQYVSCDVGIKDCMPFTLISGVCCSPNLNINIRPQHRLPNQNISFIIHSYYVGAGMAQ